MAPRSRRSAANEQPDEDEDMDGIKRLRFKQPLVSKPGKPIGVSELLARLKTLLDELRALDQEEVDVESIRPVAAELAHQSLLQHKDAGVRAWTACCLVDVFRLCAPNAPYTASHLKDIFTMIVKKLIPLLSDPSHPYNGQHLYVLKSLADIKSIVLLCDVPSTGSLTKDLFSICFDVLKGPSKADSGEELSKNVEHHMTGILQLMVDEHSDFPEGAVDVIMAQFLLADPTTLAGTSSKAKKNAQVDLKQATLRRPEAPPAYNMAKNVCNSAADKMTRHVTNYWSSVIVGFTSNEDSVQRNRRHRASSEVDGVEDEGDTGPSETQKEDARKAHRLIRELWRCAPDILPDIIQHLQTELGTEIVFLRQLATETLGDMIAGIGAAGPPALPDLNPAAYPSQSLQAPSENARPYDFLTTPTSPISFPAQYVATYQAFFQRKQDKSPIIRAAWTTAVGRILMTSAGGVGLEAEEEQRLLRSFSECLIDSDERVRLAAVKAIEHFEFNDIVQKLGSLGGISEPNTVLSNLADRVKDKKSVIHSESMKLLGRIWGVAAGAIAEGNERITNLLGPAASRILEACYVNDPEISLQVDLALYDLLLPLSYPPMKPKPAVNGGSQVVKDSQASGDQGYTEAQLDQLRAERQLVLVRGLGEKAKNVFFVKQRNQVSQATFIDAFLKICEQYNGGVMDKGDKETKAKLDNLISFIAKTFPDPARVTDDLRKFAKIHDRRAYQLIRFCMAPESDYRKIVRSIKELRKKIEDAGSALLETLIPLVYRVSLLCYNKSHVPAIIEFSRNDEKGLASTAHEVLKEISTRHPNVFKTHVKELCKTLEGEAPTAKNPNREGAVDDLKACAGFARKYPQDVPLKDNRKLVQSLVSFALYGTPPKTAKHAITIIMSCDDKKEMRTKEILSKSVKNFELGADHYLTKLAALSQLILLGPQECEEDMDDIVSLAVNSVLLKAHKLSEEAEEEWMDVPDEDMVGRTWALKILVNRLRSDVTKDNSETAEPIYNLLNKMVKDGGEASPKKNTPLAHKNLQRLLAANFLLKLSGIRRYDMQLTPVAFNELAIVLQDPCVQVRKGVATKLMKYLGQNRLPSRYYTMLFLLAYEPEASLKESVVTWIRARRAAFATRKETTLETIFSRLLSVLAHHPDFTSGAEDLKLTAGYILFYLKCVATPDNLSLIYHVAQRVKGVADGITPSTEADERLYILSDLAQAIIRQWEEQHSWSMQSWPGKLKLPAGIFKALASHDRAQQIAEKVWVADEVVEELEPLVKAAMRTKKRKAADGTDKSRKKVKADRGVRKEKVKSERPIKTPKKKRRRGDDSENDGEVEGRVQPSSEPRRKSDRRSLVKKSYAEISDEEGEDEDATGGAEEEAESATESDAESEQGPSEQVDEDAEMAEAEKNEEAESQAESEPEHESEPDPGPKPTPKRVAKSRGTKRLNGVKASPRDSKRKEEVLKAPTPAKAAKVAKSAKGKAKVNGTSSSSPATTANGSVRRSTRTRG